MRRDYDAGRIPAEALSATVTVHGREIYQTRDRISIDGRMRNANGARPAKTAKVAVEESLRLNADPHVDVAAGD